MKCKFRTTSNRPNQVIVIPACIGSRFDDVDGMHFNMVLDTAADFTLIPQHILDLYTDMKHGEEYTLEIEDRGKRQAHAYMGYLHLFEKEEIWETFQPRHGFLPTDSMYGLLGVDLLRDLVVVIDFPDALILKRD